MEVFKVSLSSEDKENLMRLARKFDVSASELIRTFIKIQTNNHKKIIPEGKENE